MQFHELVCSSFFSCEVAALDLIYSISVSNPFLNLVMQLKCLSHVHSISALMKFRPSISKSVNVHNFGFVQGQTLQVEIALACIYLCCIFRVCTGTDITGKNSISMYRDRHYSSRCHVNHNCI